MSLTVEDGTGISGADAYVSRAACLAYWANRPQLAFSATVAAAAVTDVDGAIREATTFLDATYGPFYRGVRRGYIQGLLWPRAAAYDDAAYPLPGLPPELVTATCELAARAISAPLSADVERGGQVKRERDTAGPVSTETEWADGATPETKYGFVAGILAPILTGLPGMASWLWK